MMDSGEVTQNNKMSFLEGFLFCFVLCRKHCRCQPTFLPQLSGLVAFAHLHAFVGVDRVHRFAGLQGPLPEAEGPPTVGGGAVVPAQTMPGLIFPAFSFRSFRF